MKVSVYDTYLTKDKNTIMHFDILVEEGTVDQQVYDYGKEYLKTKNLDHRSLTTEECRFCHIEAASKAVEKEIEQKGFYIIEMENCR